MHLLTQFRGGMPGNPMKREKSHYVRYDRFDNPCHGGNTELAESPWLAYRGNFSWDCTEGYCGEGRLTHNLCFTDSDSKSRYRELRVALLTHALGQLSTAGGAKL